MLKYLQGIILVAGMTGITLVIICPTWVYPSHPLAPKQRSAGYTLLTHPPAPMYVSNQDPYNHNSRGIRIEARIDLKDLFLRLGLILVVVICGFWLLQRRKGTGRTGNGRQQSFITIPAPDTPHNPENEARQEIRYRDMPILTS